VTQFRSDVLVQVTDRGPDPSVVACVTVCHNESLIIGRFLDHYRRIGVGRFYIVDDRSTDGTTEFLGSQPDVVLFTPQAGAEFKDNLGRWREEILDHFLHGRWVTLPDTDEFLHYVAMPSNLGTVAAGLDEDGIGAWLGVMIDMYADKPLSAQRYSGDMPLEQAFPYFDANGTPPHGVRIVALPSSYARRFPTPSVAFMGGVRERLFFTKGPMSAFKRWVLLRFAHMRRALNPGPFARLQNQMVRLITKGHFADPPLILNKFALLKWQRGLRFSRAPHSVSASIRTSEGIAAFLHFKFYKGNEGLTYIRDRAQHAGGSAQYRAMLSRPDKLNASPLCEDSRRFDGLDSLRDIIR
jgi:hypothetical protein